ncbi:MAG: hypothetical protein JO197_06770 [Acidobacteria bacterium]|nr:hypothetical protein [Acidobacteriota bacterium]MBV9477556.1 hypothetical protein [Acidobacteriota bacterium]
MKAVLAALASLLFLASCAHESQWDQVSVAHKRIHLAPCGATPAVAGVAGVNADPTEVYLGDWLVVGVCQLDALEKTANAEQQPITLFINGIDSGNVPAGIDYDRGTLTFVVDRNESNKGLWQPLLYDPLFDRMTSMHISVGIKGNKPLPRAEHAQTIVRLNKLYLDWTSIVWLLLLLAIVIILVVFARRSDMLREAPSAAGIRAPFSLGRSQMAWWFFLIVFGYIFIWLITGDRDSIPPSLLGLMGISAATGLAAYAVGTRNDRREAQRKRLDDEIAVVDQALTDPAANRTELEAMRAKLVTQRANLPPFPASAGWWHDLVRDERGVFALDRFQMVVWTVILGGLFLTSVIWELTMPEFSATMLALVGISSGTYIGFKLPPPK